jgi:hypothetical protein
MRFEGKFTGESWSDSSGVLEKIPQKTTPYAASRMETVFQVEFRFRLKRLEGTESENVLLFPAEKQQTPPSISMG